MDVIGTSGKKIPGLVELKSFNAAEKQFAFQNSKGKLQKISDKKIKKIAFVRVRQGVLTGKPASLRVIAWNGTIKNLEIGYGELKVKDGFLWLSQEVIAAHFADSDKLSASSHEWSDKFHQFWKRQETEAPDLYATNFQFENGRGSITRKMAAAYCRSCLKIEILNMQIDPAAEAVRIRCKTVFYDKYNER